MFQVKKENTILLTLLNISTSQIDLIINSTQTFIQTSHKSKVYTLHKTVFIIKITIDGIKDITALRVDECT